MDRARALCDAIYGAEMDIIWNCQTRVDRVDRDLLRRMKRSGCIWVDFGVESGSEFILQKLQKGTTKDQAREAFHYCHEVGIPARAFFMIGTPWETLDTVEETISFAKELRAIDNDFFIATPYPGTELREEFLKAGLPIPEDYDKYDHVSATKGARLNLDNQNSGDHRAFYSAQCRRANKALTLHQIYKPNHYPEIIRNYLRMFCPSEIIIHIARRLRRTVLKNVHFF
jgi:radical SAM superfamily enzyme YgiQ (UPF0313 family)